MSRSHQEMQLELTLWALGIAPDVPLTSLVEHLAVCQECRRLVQETYETAGYLAAGVEPRQPPEGLKAKILEQVEVGDILPFEGSGRSEASGNSAPLAFPDSPHPLHSPRSHEIQPAPDRPRQTSDPTRSLRSWVLGGVAVAFAFSLVLGNISLNRSIGRQEELLAYWQTRYETDFRWLRSAEYLLVQEMGPALVAPLVPPEGSEEIAQDRPGDPPAPQGKATVYDAYDNRVYLIVWVSGLSPGQTYEVWASGDGASRRLEALTIDEQGRGSVAYPTDSQTTWDAIEVRAVDGKAVLTGELRPREPGAGDW